MPQPAPDSDQRIQEYRKKWKADFFANMPPQPKDPVTGRLNPFPNLAGGSYCDLPIEAPDDIDLLDLVHEPPPLTPLDKACINGPASAVEEMLQGAKKYTSAALHRSLVEAIKAGNVDTVRVLLDHGAPLVRDTPRLLADKALDSDDTKIALLDLFYAHGWTPNTCSFYGSVLIESMSTNVRVLRWLLAHGADPNLGMQRSTSDRLGGPDSDSCLALERAAEAGITEAVAMLLEAGARIDNGNPLHCAAGACPPERNPLERPVRPTREFDESRVPAMALLVKAGADVNKREDTRHLTQTYAIVHAVSVGAVARAKWLLERGADPTLPARDDFYGNAIECADRFGTDEMKELLRKWSRPGLLASVWHSLAK